MSEKPRTTDEWKVLLTAEWSLVLKDLWWVSSSMSEMDHMSLNIDDNMNQLKAFISLWEEYEAFEGRQ